MPLHSSAADPVSLTIVIPALNEEEAMGRTIERPLAAGEAIRAQTPFRVNTITSNVLRLGTARRVVGISSNCRSNQVFANVSLP